MLRKGVTIIFWDIGSKSKTTDGLVPTLVFPAQDTNMRGGFTDCERSFHVVEETVPEDTSGLSSRKSEGETYIQGILCFLLHGIHPMESFINHRVSTFTV